MKMTNLLKRSPIYLLAYAICSNYAFADVYQQQAALNYHTWSNKDAEQNTRQSSVSAAFDYYFAPIFVSGPVTQHGYMQKVSQVGVKIDRDLANDTQSLNAKALSICLYPPGSSMYWDFNIADNKFENNNTNGSVTVGEARLGYFVSRKLSVGLHLSQARDHNPDAIDIEQYYRLARNDKGVFMKKIIRSGSNLFTLFETTLNRGEFYLSQNLNYQSGEFKFAVYPGRNKEFLFDFKQLRIENQETRNYAAFSNTYFFSKNNGLEIKWSKQDGTVQNESAIMLGWKLRH